MVSGKKKKEPEKHLVSAADLIKRWSCSKTQVFRIAKEERFTRYCFGKGRNGMVRFPIEENEANESSHRVPS